MLSRSNGSNDYEVCEVSREHGGCYRNCYKDKYGETPVGKNFYGQMLKKRGRVKEAHRKIDKSR